MAKLGARSTAMEALREADLAGRTAVVTGGNSGIGVETCRALAHAGARVLMTSRNLEAGQAVADSINQTDVKGKVEVVQLDLAELASVRRLADKLQQEPRIDTLILNAGIMACPYRTTKDGFESQIGTNHFGHFALLAGLLPKLKKQDFPVRVVAVSSAGHQFGAVDPDDLHWRKRKYGPWVAYGQSKAANILMVRELVKRLGPDSNIKAFSLHPGGIRTNLARDVPGWQMLLMTPIMWFIGKTVEQGAATSVYAAVAPELDGQSGAYLEDCHVSTSTAHTQDMALAARLWDATERELAAAGFKA